jgi:hypothetical protein
LRVSQDHSIGAAPRSSVQCQHFVQRIGRMVPHRVQYFGDRAGYIKKADTSLHKSFNGDFIRRIQDGRSAAPRP